MADRRQDAIATLEARLGHTFADRALLERALTHASVENAPDNERLEFLGDRVLGLVIAEHLVMRDAHADAGELTKRLHALVNGSACANVARTLGLGEALRLPGAETKRGARDLDTVIADACEALIAALYLEAGLDTAARIILTLWAPLLEQPHDPQATDPKSALQEWAAARGRPAPSYHLLGRVGPDHQPRFTVEVNVDGEGTEVASAGTLRAAEKAAALALLRRPRGAL